MHDHQASSDLLVSLYSFLSFTTNCTKRLYYNARYRVNQARIDSIFQKFSHFYAFLINNYKNILYYYVCHRFLGLYLSSHFPFLPCADPSQRFFLTFSFSLC
ncbi:hypothetical protein SUBVAR_06378 [Subdoligranulum variabile DSM 15176]|uniref:Uncharacterized protein n=1 Tax=Subdoligranulum variabile DSM 15176 TaxID=411471 RepID=D1PPR2_9FIRM|nr:hypothetical protein SUBVAR_06378 [Subdoligranulum variabile DSM 15176]